MSQSITETLKEALYRFKKSNTKTPLENDIPAPLELEDTASEPEEKDTAKLQPSSENKKKKPPLWQVIAFAAFVIVTVSKELGFLGSDLPVEETDQTTTKEGQVEPNPDIPLKSKKIILDTDEEQEITGATLDEDDFETLENQMGFGGASSEEEREPRDELLDELEIYGLEHQDLSAPMSSEEITRKDYERFSELDDPEITTTYSDTTTSAPIDAFASEVGEQQQPEDLEGFGISTNSNEMNSLKQRLETFEASMNHRLSVVEKQLTVVYERDHNKLNALGLLDNRPKISVQMVVPKRESCESCVSHAVTTISGVRVDFGDGIPWNGYDVKITGDMLQLSKGEESHSYWPDATKVAIK